MNKNASGKKPRDLVGICNINGIGEKRVAMAFHHRRIERIVGIEVEPTQRGRETSCASKGPWKATKRSQKVCFLIG